MDKAKASMEKAVRGMLGEWKRGMISFWALSLLLLRPMYGLEIAREIETSTKGAIRLGASTIYQLLRRLEGRGLVAGRWERSTQGPPRAYYEITALGREVVRAYVAEVLSPESPVAAALGVLMPKVMEELGKGSVQGNG